MLHNQSKEDYLEAIYLLAQEQEFVHQIDIARRIGVSQPAVKKALKIILDEGDIYMDGLHIYLTEQGKAYASAVYERHVIITAFLRKIGVNASDAEADACIMEHVVSEATYEAIKKFLD